MKTYTFCDFATVKDGWYWVKRYANDSPHPVFVGWSEHRQHGQRLEFYFGYGIDAGYSSDMSYFPGQPDISDDVEGVVLFGPIEVPPEIA